MEFIHKLNSEYIKILIKLEIGSNIENIEEIIKILSEIKVIINYL